MATIIDVAKKAGVSIKTVSRVMNNEPRVAQKTREKVQAAMDALSYRPSQAARQMRSGKSRAIGLLYGDPSSGYQSSLNAAMMRACERSDRYLAVSLFDEREDNWLDQLKAFLERTKVTSLVLLPPLCDSIALQKHLREEGVNFVLVSPGDYIDGAISIEMDDRKAAHEITDHLISLGHRRIGHIAGDKGHISAINRCNGYEAALQSAGLGTGLESLVGEGDFDFLTALHSAEKMLSDNDRPTAIFAANDDMAVAVFNAASKLGLRVPQDLSIVGFDDTFIAQMVWPQLTTVAQPFDAMAEKAVGLLNTPPLIDDDKVSDDQTAHLIPYEVVLRGSTTKAS